MNRFNQTEPAAPHVLQSAYSDRQFLHTFLAGAFLPLAQATITAAMVMLGSVTLLYLFDAIDLFKPALILGVFTWVVTWLYLQRRWLKLTSLERIIKTDLNGDGHIGEPTKEPERVAIRLSEITEDKHYRSQNIDLPISNDQLVTLARGLTGGRRFSRREWSGTGKTFSDSEFRDLQSAMLKYGLLELANGKDHQQGFALTRGGKAMMKYYASPSPGEEDA